MIIRTYILIRKGYVYMKKRSVFFFTFFDSLFVDATVVSSSRFIHSEFVKRDLLRYVN